MNRATLVCLVASIGLLMTPAIASGKAGDVYRKSGGPKVQVKRIRKTPSGMRVCRKYRLSARDAGKIKEQADPKLFQACRSGVAAARKSADDYAASMGLEDGYLRGYAWGLKKGVHRGIRDKDASERAKTAAFESAELSREVQKAQTSGRQLGGGDGQSYARKYFKDKFAAGVQPELDFNKHVIKIPTPSLMADPYTQLYGKLPTRKDLILKEAKSPNVTIPGSDLRAYFAGKKYPNTKLYGENGQHTVHFAAAVKVEAAWQRWSSTPREANSAYDQFNPNQKKIFEEAFRRAYDEYAPYGYATMFYRVIDVGTRDGYKLGQNIGQQARYHSAFKNNINQMYKEQVLKGFQDNYKQAFQTSFDTHVAKLKSAPIVEIKSVDLEEEVNDGVFAPGEGLIVSVAVENSGLKAAQVPAEVRGPVSDALPLWVDVPAFQKIKTKTKAVANIQSDFTVGTKAKFTVVLEKQTFAFEREIHQVLEITRADVVDVDPLNGNGTVEVVVSNPSKRAYGKGGKAALEVDTNPWATGITGILQPGTSKTLSLKFANVDPLLLLYASREQAISLTMGKDTLHKRIIDFGIEEKGLTLLGYFDSLAYGEGYVPNGRSVDEQILKVQDALVATGRAELADAKGNPWKSEPRSTILGKLVEQNATATGAAKVHYAPLGKELCKLEGEIQGPFKKKAYRELCDRLAPSTSDDDDLDGDVTVPIGTDPLPDDDPLGAMGDGGK